MSITVRIAGQASMCGSTVSDAAALNGFGGLVQQLWRRWRRWPASDARAARFRAYIGVMYWHAFSLLAAGQPLDDLYFQYCLRILADAWTGYLPGVRCTHGRACIPRRQGHSPKRATQSSPRPAESWPGQPAAPLRRQLPPGRPWRPGRSSASAPRRRREQPLRSAAEGRKQEMAWRPPLTRQSRTYALPKTAQVARWLRGAR